MGRTFRGNDREKMKRQYLEQRKIRQTKRVESEERINSKKNSSKNDDDDDNDQFEFIGV